ncbi:GspH/FimT family pseudopilin [Rhodoferax sp.]|uniref:GspH/FimT family pseudopilin n=1 Tax=Rhodoferax sp. TaxID=50421 RepID=UPI00374D1228
MLRLRGFTLIELMVTLTIGVFLLLALVPSFSTWVANARVRSVAEEMQNSLRLAQAEAIRRNRLTVFALSNASPALNAVPATNGSNWYVQALLLTGSADTASSSDFVQGSNYATQGGVTITGPALLCFSALGSLVTKTATETTLTSCSSAATTFTLARSNADRSLKVLVTVGGQVRMCDPKKTLSSTAPDGCPA